MQQLSSAPHGTLTSHLYLWDHPIPSDIATTSSRCSGTLALGRDCCYKNMAQRKQKMEPLLSDLFSLCNHGIALFSFLILSCISVDLYLNNCGWIENHVKLIVFQWEGQFPGTMEFLYNYPPCPLLGKFSQHAGFCHFHSVKGFFPFYCSHWIWGLGINV